MEVLLLAAMAAANITCFIVGAKVGQAVSKGEKVELPTANPLEVYREQKAKNGAEREQNRQDVIMQNVDNYNGSAMGQKDVPEG